MYATQLWTKRAISALALTFAVSCAASVPSTEMPPWTTADAGEGRRIFRAVCAGCHGADGTGKTLVGDRLFPRPRDLTKGEYRFRSTVSGKRPTRADMVLTLWRGLPGTAMPSWKHQLSMGQLQSVVLYLETLAPKMIERPLKAKHIIVQTGELEPPAASPELIARGKQLYKDMGCLKCHGDTGRGDGESAPTMKNQDGTRAHAFDFTYGIYKGGTRPVDIYRTFVTGLDGSPMPSYGDAIPEEKDRWALVYYCLSLGRDKGLWFYLSEGPTWQ